MTSATPRCRCPRPFSAPQDLEKAFAKNHQDHHPNPDPREGVARRESCSDKETHLAAAAVVAEDRLTGRPASVPSCTGVGIQLSKRPDRTVRFFFPFRPSVDDDTWGPHGVREVGTTGQSEEEDSVCLGGTVPDPGRGWLAARPSQDQEEGRPRPGCCPWPRPRAPLAVERAVTARRDSLSAKVEDSSDPPAVRMRRKPETRTPNLKNPSPNPYFPEPVIPEIRCPKYIPDLCRSRNLQLYQEHQVLSSGNRTARLTRFAAMNSNSHNPHNP
jgi:hypothetical protein